MPVKHDDTRPRLVTHLPAFAWGLGGVAVFLGQGITRLAGRSLEAIDAGLTTTQWIAMILWIAFMAHAEGLRGFHRRFSPRVVARAIALGEHATPLRIALAPAFCMSYFHATRRGLVVAWSVSLGIIGLVMVVSQLSQPWRGIVDAGVVVGLAIGEVSLLWYALRALRGQRPPMDPNLPEEDRDPSDARVTAASGGSS
jgi:hypothetical protein